MSAEFLLAGLQPSALPTAVARVRAWDEDHRTARRIELSAILSSPKSEHLLFRGKHSGEMFEALVEALALGSVLPGGVPFNGQVYCASHGIGSAYPCPQCAASGGEGTGR